MTGQRDSEISDIDSAKVAEPEESDQQPVKAASADQPRTADETRGSVNPSDTNQLVEPSGDDIFTFHPISSAFPLMGQLEFNQLVASIRENGLQNPILLHTDGKIIDGRNR